MDPIQGTYKRAQKYLFYRFFGFWLFKRVSLNLQLYLRVELHVNIRHFLQFEISKSGIYGYHQLAIKFEIIKNWVFQHHLLQTTNESLLIFNFSFNSERHLLPQPVGDFEYLERNGIKIACFNNNDDNSMYTTVKFNQTNKWFEYRFAFNWIYTKSNHKPDKPYQVKFESDHWSAQ